MVSKMFRALIVNTVKLKRVPLSKAHVNATYMDLITCLSATAGRGNKFPEEETVLSTTINDASSNDTMTVNNNGYTKTSKVTSKSPLGGLKEDKEFLEALVNRQGLNTSLQSDFIEGYVETSGMQVAAVAKEALLSLQHLETFMWKRDPAGHMNNAARAKSKFLTTRQRKEKAKQRMALKRKVSDVLQRLEQEEGLDETVLEGESLISEVKKAEIGEQVLCRLMISIGRALPKCGRPEDSIAVLTDAMHIAKANKYDDEEHTAVEELGQVFSNTGQHTTAVNVLETRIAGATNGRQRASLYLLIAKSYFGMHKVEIGKFYGTKSVKEAEENDDSEAALTALLAIVSAEGTVWD
ncbi:hypothetical protein SK128_018793 [Halocaridina rubra]|uniref:Uncharacterized protein n=1 Tax=Halocaridina rubra TaxID=373956 RepID=A0AAN8ZNG6_HALRR